MIQTPRQQSTANWEMTNVCCWTAEDGCDSGSQLSSRMTNIFLFWLNDIIKCMTKILLTASILSPHNHRSLNFSCTVLLKSWLFSSLRKDEVDQVNFCLFQRSQGGSVLQNTGGHFLTGRCFPMRSLYHASHHPGTHRGSSLNITV